MLTPDAADSTAAKAREGLLLAEHGATWAAPVARLVRRWEFRRSFVESVALTVGRFVSVVEELFRAAPVRCLHIVPPDSFFTALNAQVLWEEFLASPYLARLTEFNLSGCGVNGQRLEQLLACPYLGQLRVLHLRANQLEEAGAFLLAAAPLLSSLTLLDLRINGIGSAGARALRRSPCWRRQTTLRL
jgi:hypothetical protein